VPHEIEAVPPGYRLVPVRTTYLEMLRNEVPVRPVVPAGCSVGRWRHPRPDEYRALFSAVGGEWGWTGRLLLRDDELRALLDDPWLEILRLRCGSKAAGFAELDRHIRGDVEIVYFGLAPEFIGRGLGGFLLRWAIHRAWQGTGPGVPTRRLWLHTCDYDHPDARAIYEKTGFRVYAEEVDTEPYPEAFLAKRGR
jgi:GNAT superfamily N-acetyltransferase